MTRGRIALYCAVAALTYLVTLGATVPAAWVARALERAASDRLLVRAPTGTVWAGSARVFARPRAGPPIELGELRWRSRWTALLAGSFASDIAIGSAGKSAHFELSPFGMSLQELDISLPGHAIVAFAPELETFGPDGVLRLRSDSLRVEGDSILGLAEIEWGQVRFARAPGLALGSHVARLRGGGSKVVIELGTLDGPVQISGSGQWELASGLTVTGVAKHSPQVSPGLVQFLRGVCPRYHDNGCDFRLAF